MNYQKINTLWKRQENGHKKGTIIVGDYSEEEFKSIGRWQVTEKVDGMQISVVYGKGIVQNYPSELTSMASDVENTISIFGKTENAQIPVLLMNELNEIFNKEKIEGLFKQNTGMSLKKKDISITFYGEGYGKKIQEPKGTRYNSKGNSFILFDVCFDGWWLEYPSILEIANALGIKCVPTFGVMNTDEIISLVESIPKSSVSEKEQGIEGVVCTSYPMMMYRKLPRPIKFKLKCSDYERLRGEQDGKC